MKGHFEFYSRRKGFGYIIGEDGKSYFTSQRFFADKESKIAATRRRQDSLARTQVEFDIGQEEKGPVAKNVKVLWDYEKEKNRDKDDDNLDSI